MRWRKRKYFGHWTHFRCGEMKKKTFSNQPNGRTNAFLNINAYYITIFIKIFLCYGRPLTEENGQKHRRSINTFTCWNLKKRSFSSLLCAPREQFRYIVNPNVRIALTTTSIKSICHGPFGAQNMTKIFNPWPKPGRTHRRGMRDRGRE